MNDPRHPGRGNEPRPETPWYLRRQAAAHPTSARAAHTSADIPPCTTTGDALVPTTA
jgi:hypothetical protein